MYYRIPLDADLSQTSYRDSKLTETNEYIEYNEGFIGEDWKEVTEEQLIEVFGLNPFIDPEPEPEPEPEPIPYQPSNAEIAQLISDLQVDLIVAGVI